MTPTVGKCRREQYNVTSKGLDTLRDKTSEKRAQKYSDYSSPELQVRSRNNSNRTSKDASTSLLETLTTQSMQFLPEGKSSNSRDNSDAEYIADR